tara:strand:- start:5 stop:286 length:282 start_codon:yes stop_codon:yes gene_type:complete
MSRLDDLRVLFNSFLNRRQTNRRQMKRVFQWRRYLDWKDLTYEEKLSAKRFLLIPVFAYLIIWIFNQNFFLIIMLLIGYIVYKKIEQGRIVKK